MLVLSRHRDESIMIGDEIVVTIVDIRGDKVRLGIDAPQDIPVHRQEVYDAIQRENRKASQIQPNETRDVGQVALSRLPSRPGLPPRRPASQPRPFGVARDSRQVDAVFTPACIPLCSAGTQTDNSRACSYRFSHQRADREPSRCQQRSPSLEEACSRCTHGAPPGPIAVQDHATSLKAQGRRPPLPIPYRPHMWCRCCRRSRLSPESFPSRPDGLPSGMPRRLLSLLRPPLPDHRSTPVPAGLPGKPFPASPAAKARAGKPGMRCTFARCAIHILCATDTTVTPSVSRERQTWWIT